MFQITETYSFLPREAVTKFLLNCYECQKRPNSPAIKKILTLKTKNLKILPQLLENSFRVFPEKLKMEMEFSETTESSNCEQNSPENLCKRDNREIKCSGNSKSDFVHTSTPVRNENLNPKQNCRNVIGFKKGDTSSESEKSNGHKSLNIFNFTNINYRGGFEGSTGSDSSDSSFEKVKNKRKNVRKLNEIEKNRRGIFESNRMNENSKCENVFPICYPLPKFDGRKKFVVGEKGAFDEYLDESEKKATKVRMLLLHYA